MSIFENSKFGTLDAEKLRSAADNELILTGITLADDDSYFQLDFVGAFSSRYETHPRFWEAKRMESKTGRLLMSLEENLGMQATPSSLEELIHHRLMVRTTKEKNFRGDDTEYWEIVEDLGPEAQDVSVSSNGHSSLGFRDVADLINGCTEEEAWEVLEGNEDVMGDDALGRQVEDRTLIDMLEDNDFVSRTGDLIQVG